MNKMGNVLFSFLHGLECSMENPDCNKCMIHKACWWFLEVAKLLDNLTEFFYCEALR